MQITENGEPKYPAVYILLLLDQRSHWKSLFRSVATKCYREEKWNTISRLLRVFLIALKQIVLYFGCRLIVTEFIKLLQYMKEVQVALETMW